MKVLIVEDEAALAAVLRRNLDARGHAVVVSTTTQEAVEAVATTVPDVIVLDVNLPDHSGWEVLRRLPASAGGARPAVVVISAAPISRRRIEEFKPSRALQKPFPIGALVRAINEAAPSPDQDADDA